MGSVYTPFPDVEVALMAALDGLEGAGVGTVTPATLGSAGTLPFIRIMRVGGSDDRFNDSARVSIDAFGATRGDAQTLAEAIRQTLLNWPIVIDGANSCVIDKVTTNVGPMDIPWGDVNVRRQNASYTVVVRRSLPAAQ
jgi:hypothetical protein